MTDWISNKKNSNTT